MKLLIKNAEFYIGKSDLNYFMLVPKIEEIIGMSPEGKDEQIDFEETKKLSTNLIMNLKKKVICLKKDGNASVEQTQLPIGTFIGNFIVESYDYDYLGKQGVANKVSAILIKEQPGKEELVKMLD